MVCRPRRSAARRPAVSRPGRRQRAAFTLLELLLVLSILVVIGGIVVANLGGAQTQANMDATRTQLNSLKTSIQMYRIKMNALPETLQQLVDGPSDPDKKAKWIEPILPEVPGDAWENEISYSVDGNTFELRSPGVDGRMNTDDDIVETAS